MYHVTADAQKKAGDPKILRETQKKFGAYEETYQKALELEKDLYDSFIPQSLRELETIGKTFVRLGHGQEISCNRRRWVGGIFSWAE